jgi:hypothetical protein
MIETARTSETSVDNYFTWQYIPEHKSELIEMTVMFHLQCERKEYDEKSLELAAVQYQENKSVESTQLMYPLGRACGPSGVRGPPTEKLIIYIHVLMIIYWGGSLHIERKIILACFAW